MLKELGRRQIASGSFLTLQELDLEGGKKYEVCSRIGGKNAVAGIVKHVENETFILIDQYRYPLQKRVLELVAGVVDKDKPEVDIMKEEVMEELGYENIGNIEFLATTSGSAGVLSETTNLFDIEVSGKKGPQNLGELEDINIHEIPYKDFSSFLNSKIKEGLIIDPKVCMAIFMTLSKTGNIKI